MPNSTKISETRGRPKLWWTGKTRIDTIKGFPAQLIEIFSKNNENFDEGIEFSILNKNWHNLLFHGDNKEVLSFLLSKGFREKIDMIYIDPPFNTGVDYIRRVKLRGIKIEKLEEKIIVLMNS